MENKGKLIDIRCLFTSLTEYLIIYLLRYLVTSLLTFFLLYLFTSLLIFSHFWLLISLFIHFIYATDQKILFYLKIILLCKKQKLIISFCKIITITIEIDNYFPNKKLSCGLFFIYLKIMFRSILIATTSIDLELEPVSVYSPLK